MKFESKIKPATSQEVQDALDNAVNVVKMNLPMYTDKCQNHSSVDGIYPACENDQWTCGFWPGEIWLSYEKTGDECFRGAAEKLVYSFKNRIEQKISVDHHDMGFLYSPSCVAAWKLTENEDAKEAAIKAADQLLTRFQPNGNFLQAWGEMGEPGNYRYIIDCLLNIPLLFWATETTGDIKYKEKALLHLTTCMNNSFRPDGSTYHTFFMNPDGTPSHGATCQGYRDDSFWARGQAWGIYGSVLAYKYTHNNEYLDVFKAALKFYLDKLPEDLIPYWDMIFTEGDEPRDSSSAAIVACGLLEAVKYVPEDEKEYFQNLAQQMIGSLIRNYTKNNPVAGEGQIMHGTYSKKSPYNTCTPEGVDEYTSWGDYFYMEALMRLTKDWNPYW